MRWLTRPRYSRVEVVALLLTLAGLLSLAGMGCASCRPRPSVVPDPIGDTGVCEDSGVGERGEDGMILWRNGHRGAFLDTRARSGSKKQEHTALCQSDTQHQ